MTTEPKMPDALRLAENALRLQTQYTMQPTIERMNAARHAKESLDAELIRLHERVAELERVLGVAREALADLSGYRADIDKAISAIDAERNKEQGK